MQLVAGTILKDRWELRGMIKAGGMGTAWLAFDTKLKITCVAKIIDLTDDSQIAGSSGFSIGDKVKSFNREVEILAQIPVRERSAKLPRVTDYFVLDDKPVQKAVIIMDYIDGQDYEKIRQQRKVSESEAVVLALKVLKSLMALHKNGIIHRDVTPSNIIRCESDNGDDDEAFLVDLGIGKKIRGNIGDGKQTIAGKPGFAPIEQYQGEADERSDLYSLAVTLKVILTGHDPQIEFDTIPPSCNNRRLEKALAKAMSSDKKARFASAKEMYDEIYQVFLEMSSTQAPAININVQSTRSVASQISSNQQPNESDVSQLDPEVKRFLEILDPPSTNGRHFRTDEDFELNCARQERMRWFEELKVLVNADNANIDSIKGLLKILFRTFEGSIMKLVDREFFSSLLWAMGRIEETEGSNVQAFLHYQRAIQIDRDNIVADSDLQRLKMSRSTN